MHYYWGGLSTTFPSAFERRRSIHSMANRLDAVSSKTNPSLTCGSDNKCAPWISPFADPDFTGKGYPPALL